MTRHDVLADRFDAERASLRAVAYRMLGSSAEAEDAIQETWLRLCRATDVELDRLAGWLRTTITRICLDMLRARKSRREEPDGEQADVQDAVSRSPEDDTLLADAVGRAMLVVLDTLNPAERIAFVLHDMFAVPFEEIARILDRSLVAAKKLASRARHKVKGAPETTSAELSRQHRVVAAFLAAARARDLPGLLAVLAPDVVRRADAAAVPPGGSAEVRGAQAVAEGTVALAARSQYAELAVIDGTVGLVVAPRGRLLLAVTFIIAGDQITEYDVIADPARLQQLQLSVLGGLASR